MTTTANNQNTRTIGRTSQNHSPRLRLRVFSMVATLALAACMGMSGQSCVVDPVVPPVVDGPLAITPQDHVLGDPNAPITLIEYADLECPFCRRFATETFPTLKAEFIDTGKVKYVFRHFPLSIHACARVAARAAECASDQEPAKFFTMAEVILADGTTAPCSDRLKELNGAANIADAAAFNACVDVNGGKEDRIRADESTAATLKVRSTPTFFINGDANNPIVGAQAIGVFRQRLNQ